VEILRCQLWPQEIHDVASRLSLVEENRVEYRYVRRWSGPIIAVLATASRLFGLGRPGEKISAEREADVARGKAGGR
jgi:hypothetical protein